MAYSNESQKEVLTIPKNNRGDYIRVSEVTSQKGNVSVDIRTYYTSEDGEIRPTQKGVRFSSELTLDIIKALFETVEPFDLEELKDEIDKLADEDNADSEDDTGTKEEGSESEDE